MRKKLNIFFTYVFNPCQIGPFGAPMQNGKTFECPCSASSPADPEIVSEDAKKMSVLTDYWHYISFIHNLIFLV